MEILRSQVSLLIVVHVDGFLSSPVSKILTMFGIVVDCCWPYFEPLCEQYMTLFLDNANTGYAEVSTL